MSDCDVIYERPFVGRVVRETLRRLQDGIIRRTQSRLNSISENNEKPSNKMERLIIQLKKVRDTKRH